MREKIRVLYETRCEPDEQKALVDVVHQIQAAIKTLPESASASLAFGLIGVAITEFNKLGFDREDFAELMNIIIDEVATCPAGGLTAKCVRCGIPYGQHNAKPPHGTDAGCVGFQKDSQ